MLVVVGQEARGGLDVYLEDGPDGRLERRFGVMGAEGAEVVGPQQELCCIPHGRDIQGAAMTQAEQEERGENTYVRWVKVQ